MSTSEINTSSSANDHVTEHKLCPAEVGVWVFIFADMCIFAMYFWVFAWDKSIHQEQFTQGQMTLNAYLGGLNTIILLISSYFAASAVQAARNQEVKKFTSRIKLTIVCGIAFLIIKTVEYSEKFSAGFYINTNEFYRDYFSFTGFHMLHVIFGLSLLSYLLFSCKTSEKINAHKQHIEGVALYWHMVDLLWIVLFSLIYLVP